MTTPQHASGPADVTVAWALNNQNQPDIHLNYVYGVIHTVTFDKADGLSPPEHQKMYKGGAVRPADSVRQGYSFDGWFLGDVAYDFSQPVADDITLTAHWTKTSTWVMRTDRGPSSGGTSVTLTPPAPRGVKFAQISAGRNTNDAKLDGQGAHSLAIGSDGNISMLGGPITLGNWAMAPPLIKNSSKGCYACWCRSDSPSGNGIQKFCSR